MTQYGFRSFTLFLLLFVATVSQSAVITTGCASPVSCTLTELYAGGSISINDVVFDAWKEDLNFGINPSDLDADQVKVMGVDAVVDAGNPTKSNLGLNFIADPAIMFDELGYNLDFSISFNPSSSVLTQASLELVDFSILDPADAFVKVNAELAELKAGSDTKLLRVEDSAPLFDSEFLDNLTALVVDLDLQMEGENNTAGLNQFDFMLQVMNSNPNPVLEPSVPALLGMGLFGLLWFRRRVDVYKVTGGC